MDVWRADLEESRGAILSERVVRMIRSSDLVVADITGKNPNVFYEIGLAHALHRPSILIARRDEEIPFDLAGTRIVFYNEDAESMDLLSSTVESLGQNLVQD